jgi:hypothetical protein
MPPSSCPPTPSLECSPVSRIRVEVTKVEVVMTDAAERWSEVDLENDLRGLVTSTRALSEERRKEEAN